MIIVEGMEIRILSLCDWNFLWMKSYSKDYRDLPLPRMMDDLLSGPSPSEYNN